MMIVDPLERDITYYGDEITTSHEEFLQELLVKSKGIDGTHLQIPITPQLLGEFQRMLNNAKDDVSNKINFAIELAKQ